MSEYARFMNGKCFGILKFLICLWIIIPVQAPAADRKSELKIGVVVPLSGPTATFGIDCLAGLNLAVDQINNQGGIKGRLLVLEVRDNQGDPLRSAQGVSSLAEEGALAIIGAVTSNNTLAAAAVAQNAGIPMITPYATYAPVTEIGDYISRICFTDLQQASAMASYAYNALGLRKIAILSEQGSHYSESLAEFLANRFEKLGGKIVAAKSFGSAAGTISKSLAQIKSSAPDAVFLPVYYSDAALISKEISRLAVSKTILGGDGWESATFFQLVGDSLQGQQIYITSHFSAEDPRPVVRNFVRDFKERNGRNPNALSALAYDTGLMLANALGRSPQLTRSALKEAINSTVDFEGVTGLITLNEKRDPMKGVYILQAGRDEFHLRVAGLRTD